MTCLKLFSFKFLTISDEIQRKRSDVDSARKSFSLMHTNLKNVLMNVTKRLTHCESRKSRILGQVGDGVAQSGLEINKH